VNVSDTGAGSIEIDGSPYTSFPAEAIYTEETWAEIEAVAATGWVFQYWSGDAEGTDNPIDIDVNCELDVTAVFALDDTSEDPVLGYTVYIPHITGGASDWNEYIQADNLSDTEAWFTLTLYGTSGEVLYSANHSVGAYNKTVIEPKDIDDDAMSGKITYSESKLNFRTTQENNLGGGVAEFRLTDELSSSLGFYFSDEVPTIGWKGMALTNFSAATAYVRLTVLGNGGISGIYDLTIGPLQKIVGFHYTWFPLVDFSNAQVITATETVGNVCLSGVAISGDLNNELLLFTTGAPVE